MTEQAALPGPIGPFRILRLLGEGGMGRVYLAEQDTPRREVALKVLAGATASSEFQQRFRRESELLAALEHPGIARLYAAGTAETATGPVPYLAMEYVRGADLLTHARQQALSREAKLALLAKVARAVHHAHTRGVIHRDLKPANILVDEHGEPKVLDFGVAHVMGREATQMTQAGEFLGTVPYTPLEQLAAGATQVDPRWDVYALGVIAYELLSGALPYPGLSKATVLSALREILATAPVKLSRTLPGARGDLETLVMKAMAAEPAQRYASAAEFAADIDRFLQQRPIDARPPTARYVLSLFVRRHKALTAAAVLVVITLVGATLVSLQFALAARERAAEREAVNQFLEEMFAAADPDRALGVDLRVRDVLDAARRDLTEGRGLSAGALAQLQRTLGNTYAGLGLGEAGLELLRAAQGSEAASHGADSTAARRVQLDVVRALRSAGQDAAAEQALAPLVESLAGSDERTLYLAARTEQAEQLIAKGSPADAEKILRDALPEAEARFGPDDDVTLDLAFNLAESLHHLARYDEAIAQSQQVIDRLSARLGADHPRVQLAKDVIALCYREQAKYKEAEAIYRDTIAARERTMGPEHPQTLGARISLAAVLAYDGRAAEAVPEALAAHEGVLRRLGPDAEVTRVVASLRAFVVSEAGDWAQSAEINRALVAQDEKRPGGVTATDLVDYNNLGNALRKLGQPGEARGVYEKLLKEAERLVGREHTHYGLFELNYGICLTELRRDDLALPVLEHSHAVLQRELGAEHPRTQKAAGLIAEARQRRALK